MTGSALITRLVVATIPHPATKLGEGAPGSPSVRSKVAARTDDFTAFLREETTGGRLLLLATALALIWANVSESSYRAVWDAHAAIGPEWLHLDLTLGDWAADGLLAIFFFVAGLELKRELVVGVLALAGAALPSGVRVLLLSIAEVDDLLAIALIAVLFTSGLSLPWLAAGLVAAGAFSLALRRRLDPAPLLVALALVTWICIHASGVHATVAGHPARRS